MDYDKLLKIAEYFERKAQAYSGETERNIEMYAKEFDPNVVVNRVTRTSPEGVPPSEITFEVIISPSPDNPNLAEDLTNHLNNKLRPATVTVSYGEKYEPVAGI